IKSIIRQDGIRGLYRGIIPNLVKVTPSMATSFGVYEATKDLLDEWAERREEEERRGD
ncbi:hypothetical protein JCM11251_002584, partial [Rhodosporidiobolus azoricus]